MNISKAFGQRLKTARTQAGLSQPELAKQCGWDSQSRVSNYERGERTPSLDDIDKLSRALGTDICQLVSNNAQPNNNQINEDSTTYCNEIINKEIREVIQYAINNQLNDYYIKLTPSAQVKLVFELYNSAYKDRALLDAAKNMQASTLLKMVNG